MFLKRLGAIAALVSLLTVLGCEKEKSDKRLVDIAVRQNKLQREFGRTAKRIEGIERRLDEILASARKGSPASTQVGPAKTAGATASGLKESPAYRNLAAALSEIHEQFNLTQSDLSIIKEEVDTERRTDPVQQLMAMKNPREMTKRLDALLKNFTQKIGDHVQTRAFESHVKQLKWINSENLSTEELSERLVSHLRQKVDTVQEENWRKGIEYRLEELASPEDDDLRRTVHGVRDYANFMGLREMMSKHGIPPEALNDVGLPDPSAADVAAIDEAAYVIPPERW